MLFLKVIFFYFHVAFPIGIKFLGGAVARHWYFNPIIKEVVAYYERYIYVTQNTIIYFFDLIPVYPFLRI
jgi:hypothetical protein